MDGDGDGDDGDGVATVVAQGTTVDGLHIHF